MNLAHYRDVVLALRAEEGPFLTASLDLSLGPDARGLARVVFRTALAAALAGAERGVRDVVDSLAAVVESAIGRSTEAGISGLYLVGAPGAVTELESPLPFRNHVRLGGLPWVFELERQTYRHSRPVLAVEVTRSGVRIVRIEGIALSATMNLARDEHATQRIHGRSATEGRSGATWGSGGHSRSRVEHVVEEKRALAAREAARDVEALRQPGDLLVVAGTPEPKAEFLEHLPTSAADAMVELNLNSLPCDSRELVHVVADVTVGFQLATANSHAARIIAGAAGEKIVRGLVAVEGALRVGRVSELVVHEDVVAHWGDALDARRQQPGWDDAPYEALVRAARGSSAEVHFSNLPDLMERYQGTVAATRW